MSRIPVAVLTALLLGCTNSPPSTPVVLGPDSASRGDTVWFRIHSVDPEESQICYMMDWGDTTAQVWSYFFWSGDTVERSHVYPEAGRFLVRCRARDIDGRNSDWSETHPIQILPSQPVGIRN
ncbi:MAG: hypothetical protein ABIK86_00080 [candidate division WOR-3 bacterium]